MVSVTGRRLCRLVGAGKNFLSQKKSGWWQEVTVKVFFGCLCMARIMRGWVNGGFWNSLGYGGFCYETVKVLQVELVVCGAGVILWSFSYSGFPVPFFFRISSVCSLRRG